jgi:hypothetical protein
MRCSERLLFLTLNRYPLYLSFLCSVVAYFYILHLPATLTWDAKLAEHGRCPYEYSNTVINHNHHHQHEALRVNGAACFAEATAFSHSHRDLKTEPAHQCWQRRYALVPAGPVHAQHQSRCSEAHFSLHLPRNIAWTMWR